MIHGFDVLILGGGVAGTAAALAAAASAVRVGLLRAAPGTTALAAGGWRGPLPEGLSVELAASGLAHSAVSGPLPHPTGTLYACDHAPAAQCAAIPVDGALVCGIDGLAGFHARSLARAWGERAGVRLRHATIRMHGETPAGGWSPASLAAAIEREPGRLAEPLAGAVRQTGATRVILPAVLGLDGSDTLQRTLADAAGVRVGEALGVPPSLPGWRLQQALDAALDRAGVVRVHGRVVDRSEGRGRLSAVVVEQGERFTASAFVLATGKFAAGGLSAARAIRETALGCPVALENGESVPDLTAPLALTRAERTAPQPLLRVGVRVDDTGRPLDRRGGVLFSNLWAAGSVIAGHDAAGLGLGRAAVEGWRVGECAAGAA